MNQKYELVLTLAKLANETVWQFADAILDAIPFGEAGINIGTNRKLQELSKYLSQNGMHYSWNTLRSYRECAFRCGPDSPFRKHCIWIFSTLRTEEMLGDFLDSGLPKTSAAAKDFKHKVTRDSDPIHAHLDKAAAEIEHVVRLIHSGKVLKPLEVKLAKRLRNLTAELIADSVIQ